MRPTEYMIHEHRKEMLRTAEQVRFARASQAQHQRHGRSLALRLIAVVGTGGWLHFFRRPRRLQPPCIPSTRPAVQATVQAIAVRRLS